MYTSLHILFLNKAKLPVTRIYMITILPPTMFDFHAFLKNIILANDIITTEKSKESNMVEFVYI